MLILVNQDRDELIQTTQVFYKKHYYKKSLFAKKQLMGWNLLAYDLKGKTTLLGTFDTEEEVLLELVKINNNPDPIKYVTIY